jgi:phage gpG-like protein
MGGAIIVSIDDTQVLSMLERVRNLTTDFREPLRNAGIYAMRQVDKHFQEEMGPDEPWEELSDVTLDRRRKGKKKGRSDKILQDTGTLKKSVIGGGSGHIERLGQMQFEFGTSIEYAGIHQYGTVSRGGTLPDIKMSGAITVRHALTKSGQLKKQKSNKNLLVFAKRSNKNFLERSFAMKERTVGIPPRPFLWLSTEAQEHITGIFGIWAKHKLEDL